ncbi:TIGR02206 family membrane protein [Anaerotruncus sp. AF02-27]|jgi:hypothetical integral membrane protein (TIGR02206 family)|uniref:YwaF family protein n=1 Tax=Anaerotruncus sp. AF02-27 TaxID=2292191 RepID=UPI00082CF728|nr:TIGR02206 family membrane protein [Anaerotruncus sp. AF02-27]RGX54275.1 TIGR02206 family membrane protein [Anaerotruncus sp. AF02-27]
MIEEGDAILGFFAPANRILPGTKGVAIFSPMHLAWLVGVFLFCIWLLKKFDKQTASEQKHWLRIAAAAMLSSELLRMLLLLLSGSFDPAWALPLHLCGVMIFVEFLAVWTRQDFLCELSFALGMPGAFFALVTPGETAYPFWNFYYLQFILVHTLLFLIPLFFVSEGFLPRARRLPGCFLFLLAVAGVDAAANTAFGGNYLFLGAASPGSPLEMVQRLAGRWYFWGTAALVWALWGLLYSGMRLLRRAKPK